MCWLHPEKPRAPHGQTGLLEPGWTSEPGSAADSLPPPEKQQPELGCHCEEGKASGRLKPGQRALEENWLVEEDLGKGCCFPVLWVLWAPAKRGLARERAGESRNHSLKTPSPRQGAAGPCSDLPMTPACQEPGLYWSTMHDPPASNQCAFAHMRPPGKGVSRQPLGKHHGSQ